MGLVTSATNFVRLRPRSFAPAIALSALDDRGPKVRHGYSAITREGGAKDIINSRLPTRTRLSRC